MKDNNLCVRINDGILNVRVGAIIVKNGRFLMVRNTKYGYYYSVGGRIKLGESAERAVEREVEEETGVKMKVDRLAVVNECFFYDLLPGNTKGKLIHELAFCFYMRVPEDFEPLPPSSVDLCDGEYLEWVSPDTPLTVYPDFFRRKCNDDSKMIEYIVIDEREKR